MVFFFIIIIVNKLVHSLRRSGLEGTIFKINFEKVYDHVNWGFVHYMLRKMGFVVIWRVWIWGFISPSSFSVLVNGSPYRPFKASKDLSRGDPSSPLWQKH